MFLRLRKFKQNICRKTLAPIRVVDPSNQVGPAVMLHLLLWWWWSHDHMITWWSHDSNDNILMMMRRVDKGTPRLDVMNLQEQLDLKLQQRQARETGICQVSSPWDPILPLSILISDSPRTVRPVLRWTHKTGFVNHWITGYQLKQSQNL